MEQFNSGFRIFYLILLIIRLTPYSQRSQFLKSVQVFNFTGQTIIILSLELRGRK